MTIAPTTRAMSQGAQPRATGVGEPARKTAASAADAPDSTHGTSQVGRERSWSAPAMAPTAPASAMPSAARSSLPSVPGGPREHPEERQRDRGRQHRERADGIRMDERAEGPHADEELP